MSKLKNNFSLALFFLLIFLLPFVFSVEGITFSENPNELQKIYSKSLPSIVKINVYYGYDVFIPTPIKLDFGNSFDWEYPFYEDLRVRIDEETNAFDEFFGDSFWEEFYVGEYYYSDDLGYTYTIELTQEDLKDYEEIFNDYHNNLLPYVTGTGFIISPEGHILTNAHVATLLYSEIEEIEEWIAYDNYLYYYHFLYDNSNYNEEVSMRDFEDYTKNTLFLEENLEISNVRIDRIEIVLGEGSNAQTYDATLVDFNENYLEEVGGRDWALLKIEGGPFSSLELGDSDNIPIGEDIVVIGYPWTSEGISEDVEINHVAPTPTYGKVSNLVSSGIYKDIQIDISIEEGNSGGPGLNKEGKVIGIATSGYEGLSGSYNYLTPINDVKGEILINYEKGEVSSLWEKGLENFWQKNYKSSREDFEEIIQINPNQVYVENILNQLEKFPESDEGEKVESKNSISTTTIIFTILGIVIIILLSIIIFKMSKKDKK